MTPRLDVVDAAELIALVFRIDWKQNGVTRAAPYLARDTVDTAEPIYNIQTMAAVVPTD